LQIALIDPADVDIPICVANSEEAIAIIRDHKKSQADAIKQSA